MRSAAAGVAICCLLTGCGQDAGRQLPGEAPARPAAVSDPQGLFARADSIDALAAARPSDESVWARIAGRLRQQPDTGAWPDSAEAEIRIFRDGALRPLRHVESPAKGTSGPTLVLFHYFDTTGNTFVVRSIGSSFKRGCPTGVVRDRRRTSYERGLLAVASERRLEDNAGRPLDERVCTPDDPFTGQPRGSFADLQRAGLAP